MLRDYQKEIIDKVDRAQEYGHKSVLVQLPTGGGKTRIVCEMIRQRLAEGRRQCFVAPGLPLIEQTSETLDALKMDHGIIQGSHPRTNYKKMLQVCTWQTLHSRLGDIPPPDDIYFDECHGMTEDNCFGAISAAYPNAYDVGLTATPLRLDGKGMGDIFDWMVKGPSVNQLVRAGWIKPHVVVRGRPMDLTGVSKVGGDYNQGELSERATDRLFMGDVVLTWKRFAEGRPTILFAPKVEDSKAYAKMFCDAGIPALHIDANTSRDERRAACTATKDRKNLILCSVGVFKQGFDLPAISCGIICRPTLSLALYLQMGGRILRPEFGRCVEGERAILIDHCGMTHRHGYLNDERPWSLKSGVDRKVELLRPDFQCPSCDAILKGWPAICPNCGAVLKEEDGETYKIPVHVDVPMELIDPHEMERTLRQGVHLAEGYLKKIEEDNSTERQRFFANLVQDYHQKWADAGRKKWPPIAVCMAFKGKYGGFPSRHDMMASHIRVDYDPVAKRWMYVRLEQANLVADNG